MLHVLVSVCEIAAPSFIPSRRISLRLSKEECEMNRHKGNIAGQRHGYWIARQNQALDIPFPGRPGTFARRSPTLERSATVPTTSARAAGPRRNHPLRRKPSPPLIVTAV